jgi:hypothetical protein
MPDAQRLLDAFEYVQIDEDVGRSAMVEPTCAGAEWYLNCAQARKDARCRNP